MGRNFFSRFNALKSHIILRCSPGLQRTRPRNCALAGYFAFWKQAPADFILVDPGIRTSLAGSDVGKNVFEYQSCCVGAHVETKPTVCADDVRDIIFCLVLVCSRDAIKTQSYPNSASSRTTVHHQSKPDTASTATACSQKQEVDRVAPVTGRRVSSMKGL